MFSDKMIWKKHEGCTGNWLVIKEPITIKEHPYEFKCDGCGTGMVIDTTQLTTTHKEDLHKLDQRIILIEKLKQQIEKIEKNEVIYK